MANIITNCFICNQVSPDLTVQTDPHLSSRVKNLFVLFQRAVDLIDLGGVQSEVAAQISFCKSCLDEQDVTKNMLDKLMQLVELVKTKMRLKFLESKIQYRGLGISSKGLELDGGAAAVGTGSESQLVAVPNSSSTSTLMTDSSETPGIFSPGPGIARTGIELNHFLSQTTPSEYQTIFNLPDFGLGRSSSVSSVSPEIQNAQLLDTNGQDGVQNISNDSGGETTSYDDLDSEQWSSDATTNSENPGMMAKASSDPYNAIRQISSGEENKPPTSPSIPSNNHQNEPTVNEKKHKCQVCPASFKDKHKLTVHTRVHSGEKPYSCSFCSKTFSDESCLVRHKVLHGGGKPRRCRICPKAFARPSDLKIHERIHTREQPFECKMCSMKFSQAGHCRRHMEMPTREKPYKCTICSEEFLRQGCVKYHKKTHR